MDIRELKERAKTLPKTTFEERRVYYKDVEEFIMFGFITTNFSINNVNFSIRSPNKGDIFLINNYLGSNYLEADWKIKTISQSIWMIDGVNLLAENNYIKITEPFVDLLLSDKYIADIVYNLYLNLYGRIEKATEAVEPFCLEPYSRSLWRTLLGYQQNTSVVCGIPGISRIGLNPIQQMWNSYNTYKDRIEEMEAHWECAKFIASATSPKGVDSVNNKDKNRKKKEEDNNQRQRDLFYYKKLGLVNDTGTNKDGSLRVSNLKSIEELDTEYKNWVEGKEDWHDKIVNDYKEKIEKMMEEKIAYYNSPKLVEKEQEEAPFVPKKLIAYTSKQLDEMGIKNSTTRSINSEETQQREYLYNKFIKNKEKAPSKEGLSIIYDEKEGSSKIVDLGENKKNLNLADRRTNILSEKIINNIDKE